MHDITPIFETKSDKQRELEIAQQVARAWGMELIEHRRFYPADFSLRWPGKPHVIALMEAKDRYRYTMKRLDDLGGFKLSLQKLANIEALCRVGRLRFVLAVKDYDRRIWYCAPEQIADHDGVGIIDRTDRGLNETEPAAIYRAHRFELLA